MSGFLLAEQAAEQNFLQGYPITQNELQKGYNAPSRIEDDFYLAGSYIYWQPIMNGFVVGVDISPSTSLPIVVQHDDISYNFASGFKVEAGLNIIPDEWTVDAAYTWLHGSDSGTAIRTDAASTFTIPWDVQSGVSLYGATGKWTYKLDLIDLSLARPCYVGTNLTIAPLFGMRGGWIDNDFEVHATTTTNIISTMKNTLKSWLIGFRPGVRTNWLFGSGIRLFSDVYMGMYYQDFSIDYYQNDETAPSTVYSTSSLSKKQLATNIELFSGLGYGTYLNDNKQYIDLLLGYTFQVFFNQNFLGVDTSSTSAAEDLMLQGLNARLSIHF